MECVDDCQLVKESIYCSIQGVKLNSEDIPLFLKNQQPSILAFNIKSGRALRISFDGHTLILSNSNTPFPIIISESLFKIRNLKILAFKDVDIENFLPIYPLDAPEIEIFFLMNCLRTDPTSMELINFYTTHTRRFIFKGYLTQSIQPFVERIRSVEQLSFRDCSGYFSKKRAFLQILSTNRVLRRLDLDNPRKFLNSLECGARNVFGSVYITQPINFSLVMNKIKFVGVESLIFFNECIVSDYAVRVPCNINNVHIKSLVTTINIIYLVDLLLRNSFTVVHIYQINQSSADLNAFVKHAISKKFKNFRILNTDLLSSETLSVYRANL